LGEKIIRTFFFLYECFLHSIIYRVILEMINRENGGLYELFIILNFVLFYVYMQKGVYCDYEGQFLVFLVFKTKAL
jgi:hypothetical protein